MATSLSSISGLISGFNYNDLVDAIIAQARQPAARMEADLDALKAKATAIGTYRGLLDTLRTASAGLSSGIAFDSTSATITPLTGTRAVGTAVTTPAATAQTFTLAVTSLARAEKLSSTATVADATTPLNAAGTFTVNGQTVTVAAGDSLQAIRDKINALNTGTTPTGISASVLNVSATDRRLILTSTATGAAGATLADTSGTVLKDLGFLDNLGAKRTEATVVAGSNANFTVDGVPLTRTSNEIADVFDGVTITLTSEEAGATTRFEIGRFTDAASKSMQAFVDAYNGLVGFIKQQSTVTTSRPALYGDSVLRTARAALPQILLETVTGAAADFATASRAGLSLTREGTLSFDAAVFKTAFESRYDDIRALFTEQRTSSTADLTLVSSGGSAAGGTRAVQISALATRAVLSTTGFAGIYDDGGTPDTVTFTDTHTGLAVDVVLTSGMTTSDIVTALQNAFDTAGLGLTADAVGNEIRLTQNEYGLGAGITVSVQGAGDGAAEAWGAADAAFGTNIQGTIDGEAATGSGQTLVGNSGTAAAGLTVRYTGGDTGAIGTVTLGVGVGRQIERLLDGFLQSGDGSIAQKLNTYDARSAQLNSRIDALDARLARRRAVMLANFLQMESAIARLKQQSTSLLGTTSALSSNS